VWPRGGEYKLFRMEVRRECRENPFEFGESRKWYCEVEF